VTVGVAFGNVIAHRPFPVASPMMAEAGLGFRPVEAKDRPFLRALYADIRATELSRTGWPALMIQGFLDQQFDLQSRHFASRHPDADLLILTGPDAYGARHDIGRLYLDRTTERWRLMELAVLTAWRSRGYGGLILDWLAQAARAYGVSAIDLSVAVDNPRAQALYARHGYRVEGVATAAATHRSMSRSFS